jgi:hypothetical protein
MAIWLFAAVSHVTLHVSKGRKAAVPSLEVDSRSGSRGDLLTNADDVGSRGKSGRSEYNASTKKHGIQD